MKAIIIADHDSFALLEKIKLARLELEQRHVVDECFRRYWYDLVGWLKEQGAAVVR